MFSLPFTMVCCSDFAGQIRGKGFPTRDLDGRWSKGVGWTPTNIMINCFGQIPATPWKAEGDLALVPVPEGEVKLDFGEGDRLHFILGNIQQLDGTPWACCPRSYAADALAILEGEFGLRLNVAFEHELTLINLVPRLGSAYGLDAIHQIGSLPAHILGALDAAGLAPDTFLPEYSPGQFEVTVDPAIGLEAADRAIKLRQIIRYVCARAGHTASFSPIMRAGGVGNGVHIHFSLQDMAGQPVTYDPEGPHGLSGQAASFVAGILQHGRALTTITAPSDISYERLRPNAWSASSTNLGVRDREALVRICPVSERPGADVAKAFNCEYRAADAAASPYMALGALVLAGIDGLRRGLTAPDAQSASAVAGMTDQAREALGIAMLPGSLDEALDALELDDVLMSGAMRDAYLMHKRGEVQTAAGFGSDKFSRYAEVY